MALCVLLIGGVLVGREFQGEIGKKLRLEAVRPEPPPKSDPVPKNDSVPVRTTVTTLVPPPPKLGKYEPPVIPDFGVVYTVASWGGGFQGRDVLDLGIGSRSGALGRISSVTWKFPADWSPATHVATTPANGFAVRIQPLAPFRVTATITQTDGAVFSVVQDIRWR
jgi:hypothetical protein